MYTEKVLFFPIKILLSFLIFTEVLYFLGPIEFNICNPPLLILYFVVSNLALYLGYAKGLKKSPVTRYDISLSIVKIFFIITLFLKFYELNYIWTGRGIPVSITSIVNAIFNPGKAYYSEAKGFVSGSGMIRLLVVPFTWAAIPLGILYWNKMKSLIKAIIVIVIMVELCVWLGIGVRKGIFDVLVIFLFLFFAKNASIILDKRKMSKILIIFAFFLVSFLVYFVFSNMSRGGKDLSDFADMLVHRVPKSIYSDNLPSWLFLSFMTIEDYLCQGYDALDKALDIGFITPIPFSSNWFSIELSNYFLKYNPFKGTYLDLLYLREGIDPMINWHSIYVWLANTFTFIGTPLIIYFIGYFFAQTWKDALYKMNPAVYPLLALFVVMVFYFFANNQVFSSSFSAFWFWFLFYQLTKKRVKL